MNWTTEREDPPKSPPQTYVLKTSNGTHIDLEARSPGKWWMTLIHGETIEADDLPGAQAQAITTVIGWLEIALAEYRAMLPAPTKIGWYILADGTRQWDGTEFTTSNPPKFFCSAAQAGEEMDRHNLDSSFVRISEVAREEFSPARTGFTVPDEALNQAYAYSTGRRLNVAPAEQEPAEEHFDGIA